MQVRRNGSLAALAALFLMVGCTPPPSSPNPVGEVPPTISFFGPTRAPSSSPALVTLRWNVADLNGDDLTCDIDVDGDSTADISIRSCQGVGSRNVSLSAVDGVSTTHSLTLTVNDGVEVDGVVGTATSTQTVVVNPGPVEPFDITLVGVDDLDPEPAAAFSVAAARWQQAIVAGLPDVNGTTLGCTSPDGDPLPELIDDVLIYVKVEPIDGPGSVLGSAGPSCIMMSNELTVIGVMTFDSADVANMVANGTFGSVILHEMGHVLGIGTLWDTAPEGGARRLLTGAGGADPRFVGSAGAAEWEVLNHVDKTGIPVENSGGGGTVDSHWRESVFDTELMTGWIDQTAPLSAMTIASLADLGYHVDMSVADAFTLGGAAVRGADAAETALTVLRPTIEVSGNR